MHLAPKCTDGGSGNDLSRNPPAFGCLLQQRFHCEMLVSECVQECAGDCKHSVLFGFAKEAQFTFNCFVHISNRCSLFSCQWLPVLGMQELGMWQAGCLHVLGQSKSCLPCLPCLLCLLPTPSHGTWLLPRTRLFNAWLLIALEIITFKLLVGDF